MYKNIGFNKYIGTFNKTIKINKNIYVEVILISISHYNIY